MSRASEGDLRNRSGKFECIAALLSHDLAHCSAHRQPTEHPSSPNGQIAFTFTGTLSESSCTEYPRLVGFDEAGRGSLAGPVTVACVSFDLAQVCQPSGDLREGVLETYEHLNDSKKVPARIRQRLFDLIIENTDWGIGCASAVEIDAIGIVPACQLAARRAYRMLGIRVDRALFDRGLSLGEEATTSTFLSAQQITKGDAKSFHIAAASILAKVRRDAILCDLGTRAPTYGFAAHKGYGTAAHFEAIGQHGPSKFHRRTFLKGDRLLF